MAGDRLHRMEKIVEGLLLDAHILLEQSQMILLQSQVFRRNGQRDDGPARN
jgi:hypothetical protein